MDRLLSCRTEKCVWLNYWTVKSEFICKIFLVMLFLWERNHSIFRTIDSIQREVITEIRKLIHLAIMMHICTYLRCGFNDSLLLICDCVCKCLLDTVCFFITYFLMWCPQSWSKLCVLFQTSSHIQMISGKGKPLLLQFLHTHIWKACLHRDTVWRGQGRLS